MIKHINHDNTHTHTHTTLTAIFEVILDKLVAPLVFLNHLFLLPVMKMRKYSIRLIQSRPVTWYCCYHYISIYLYKEAQLQHFTVVAGMRKL